MNPSEEPSQRDDRDRGTSMGPRTADVSLDLVAALSPETTLEYALLLGAPLRSHDVEARVERLDRLLGAQEIERARERLRHFAQDASERSELELSWSEVFVRGKVPPYETSYAPPTMAGHVRDIADVAGFYRAFGFEVKGERPDHLVPELEFTSFALFKWREASQRLLEDAARVCGDAVRSFLADHLGTWIGPFAHRLSEEMPASPYVHAVDSLSEYVSALCRSLDVEPSRPDRALTSHFLGPAEEEELPGCFGCPVPGDRILDVPD